MGEKEPCINCKGEGILPFEFNILDNCRHCNGSGKMEWIDNLVPKDIDKLPNVLQQHLTIKTIYGNIELLIRLLRLQCLKIGWLPSIKIDSIPVDEDAKKIEDLNLRGIIDDKV